MGIILQGRICFQISLFARGETEAQSEGLPCAGSKKADPWCPPAPLPQIPKSYLQKVHSDQKHYFKKQPVFHSIVSNSKKILQRSLSSDQMLSRQNIYFFFNYRRKLPFQHMAQTSVTWRPFSVSVRARRPCQTPWPLQEAVWDAGNQGNFSYKFQHLPFLSINFQVATCTWNLGLCRKVLLPMTWNSFQSKNTL